MPELLDRAGRRRSPATMPGFHAGRSPGNKGRRYPADPPKVEEILAVMHAAGDFAPGRRLRGLIVILWRAGLRIHKALALTEAALDARRPSAQRATRSAVSSGILVKTLICPSREAALRPASSATAAPACSPAAARSHGRGAGRRSRRSVAWPFVAGCLPACRSRSTRVVCVIALKRSGRQRPGRCRSRAP
jgi:hypothetical protein